MSLLRTIQWARAQDLQRTAKSVLMAVATRCHEGETFASMGLIAEEACVTTRCASMTLGFLELNGFIRREKRYRRNGSRDSDLIVLLIDRPPAQAVVYCRARGKSPLNVAGMQPGESDSGQVGNPTSDRVESQASPVRSDSPLTSFEATSKSQEDSPRPPEGARRALASLGFGEGTAPSSTFDILLAAYPKDGRAWADLEAARRTFQALDPADQAEAIAAAPAYARDLATMRRKPYALQRWLRKRLWRNERRPAAPVPAAATERAFVAQDTAAWDAWELYLRSRGQRLPFTFRSDVHRADGAHFPAAWPPGLVPPAAVELRAP